MGHCGYDNDIQPLCVGPENERHRRGLYLDEQWVVRRMAFEAAHACIAASIGGERTDNVVRLQRAQNPQNKRKRELLDRCASTTPRNIDVKGVIRVKNKKAHAG